MKTSEVIRILEDAGWELSRTRGSHRQYKHPDRPGKVTVPGKPSSILHPKTLASILRQAGMEKAMTHRYLIVVEGDGSANYSAYSPDVPGVVAVGDTREECEREMREAIEFHIEGLAEDGEPVPEAHSTAGYAVVQVA